MILTYRYRVKGKSAASRLSAMARGVNTVWNFCGETQEASRRHNKRRPSGFDLINLTSGSFALLGLHSDTIAATCRQFAVSRNKIHRRPRWRGRRSLGWVPFQRRSFRLDGDVAIFLGHRYRLWLSRQIGGPIHSASFCEDARGRWYLNLQCEVEATDTTCFGEVGIDLGLLTLAALSTGDAIVNSRHLRRHARRLATAQRANRAARARAIHAKIRNARRHQLHIETTRLARENSLICVGNVSSAKLARTRMAKSVLDAGWSTFRTMLRYKVAMRRGVYIEVDERGTSRACSDCGNADGGPKGLKGLGVRSWVCQSCGSIHDRDVNAARNILTLGRNLALH